MLIFRLQNFCKNYDANRNVMRTLTYIWGIIGQQKLIVRKKNWIENSFASSRLVNIQLANFLPKLFCESQQKLFMNTPIVPICKYDLDSKFKNPYNRQAKNKSYHHIQQLVHIIITNCKMQARFNFRQLFDIFNLPSVLQKRALHIIIIVSYSFFFFMLYRQGNKPANRDNTAVLLQHYQIVPVTWTNLTSSQSYTCDEIILDFGRSMCTTSSYNKASP